MLKKYLSNQKGFTLIEMMVVLIIIAVLIGGGIKFYLGYVEKAKITKAKADISTMQAALDSYYAEENEYPTGDNLADTGLATDMIGTGDDLPYNYKLVTDKKKYEIWTTTKFNDKVVKGTGEKGKSDPPELSTTP